MKYVIINSSEVTNIDFSQVVQTSADTIRYSIDGTKTVVKFEGDTPSFLEGKTQYTKEEVSTILASAEWTSDE